MYFSPVGCLITKRILLVSLKVSWIPLLVFFLLSSGFTHSAPWPPTFAPYGLRDCWCQTWLQSCSNHSVAVQTQSATLCCRAEHNASPITDTITPDCSSWIGQFPEVTYCFLNEPASDFCSTFLNLCWKYVSSNLITLYNVCTIKRPE